MGFLATSDLDTTGGSNLFVLRVTILNEHIREFISFLTLQRDHRRSHFLYVPVHLRRTIDSGLTVLVAQLREVVIRAYDSAKGSLRGGPKDTPNPPVTLVCLVVHQS